MTEDVLMRHSLQSTDENPSISSRHEKCAKLTIYNKVYSLEHERDVPSKQPNPGPGPSAI